MMQLLASDLTWDEISRGRYSTDASAGLMISATTTKIWV
jgi:hypothetical protein